jgi:hypothetical protein
MDNELYCPECYELIHNVREHLLNCDVDPKRFYNMGLLTDETLRKIEEFKK